MMDAWMVARLAAELHDLLAGSRVQALASGPDRLDLQCRGRSIALTLQVSLDPQGPVAAALDEDVLRNENGPVGWAGGVAPLLRGNIVESVRAVQSDRIISIDLRSRSAFGVPARHRIALELEPLKPNALVLRPLEDGRYQILAAHKQVRGQGGARDIIVGEEYVPPPPRTRRRELGTFDAAIDAAGADDDRSLTRLLSELDVRCTQPLAREAVHRFRELGDAGPSRAKLLAAWEGVLRELEDALRETRSPVYCWMKGTDIALCHIVKLSWPPGPPVVHPTFNECAASQLRSARRRRVAPASAALAKRLAKMLERADIESGALRRAQAAGDAADGLRLAGDAIYANLTEIPVRATSFTTPDGLSVALDPDLTPKENAAAYFKRFKKARSGLPRVAARLGAIERQRAFWEQLQWELERAQRGSADELSAACAEIAEALGSARQIGTRRPAAIARVKARTVDLGEGAVAHVGRSPKDNERVTFSVGSPDDLWFHARGIPGAHVVLKMDGARRYPTDAQILAAAALAAGQSRASDAAKVEVDYTQRKHVRKQGGGRTGLVWYTDFKTVRVSPQALAPVVTPAAGARANKAPKTRRA